LQAAQAIYKVFRLEEWLEFASMGHSPGSPADRRDGFVHLSTASQLSSTIEKHFSGEEILVLAQIDAGVLGPALKWEPAGNGVMFPHHYGPLVLGAITHAKRVVRGPDGFSIPDAISELVR
jgi:uncharacterized protein (DUF952 family)